MASAKFLEEALSTDVDESAVNAIVGSLENQLVTSSSTVTSQQQTVSGVINQNHVNSAISNGGGGNVVTSTQKHCVANGESIVNDSNKSVSTCSVVSNVVQTSVASAPGVATSIPNTFVNHTNVTHTNMTNMSKANEGIKLIYPPGSQAHTTATIINNRVAFPTQSMPNGTIGLGPLSQQAVLQTSVANAQNKQPALVLKTTAASGQPGLVTVPMNATTTIVNSSMPASSVTGVVTIAKPMNSATASGQPTMVGSQCPPTAIIPSNVQIVNVRPGAPAQAQHKVISPRVVLGPQMIGARPGTPITIQSLQQLQPGQQSHLLLKTENGQYQLLRVGPAPPTAGTALPQTSQVGGTGTQQTTFRLQTVPAVSRLNTQFTGPPLTLRKTIVQQQPTTIAGTPVSAGVAVQQAAITTTPVSGTITPQSVAPGAPIVTQTAPKQTPDNTKEKCRKFLANLLELSSREPKNVERNVRTLIQELIDCTVEPEQFCDRLERLLNASPQPCLIGFLKKSLPLLRQSLVLKEMVIDGIKPPPHHVVFSIANSSTVSSTVQTQVSQVRAQTPTQVRVMAPGTGIVRPGVQPRLATPLRGPSPQPRILGTATIRQQAPLGNVIVPTSQPPALHPVSGTVAPPLFPTAGAQVRPGIVRPQQLQQVRVTVPNQVKSPAPVRMTAPKSAPSKPSVPSMSTKPAVKEKEKKSSFSSMSYVPDDDINDVAAMGGVNLAEETQRILGSTEFVGTQIRSCKDELFLHVAPLQQRLRHITNEYGLDDASCDVTALVSHATQELLKNTIQKLAVIAEHRIEIVKTDARYEVTQDVRGQLKFLEELDRAERKRHDEQERELLLRAAKSRSKTEDPEQAKLKAKAKEMQRAEMEELRQREANLTALQAIGPRKKPKLDIDSPGGSMQMNSGTTGSNLAGRPQLPMRPRLKRVNLRDVLFMLEQEKDKCRSLSLYRAYLK